MRVLSFELSNVVEKVMTKFAKKNISRRIDKERYINSFELSRSFPMCFVSSLEYTSAKSDQFSTPHLRRNLFTVEMGGANKKKYTWTATQTGVTGFVS